MVTAEEFDQLNLVPFPSHCNIQESSCFLSHSSLTLHQARKSVLVGVYHIGKS